MMPLKRGALIVLEGCDRSGKSTQCKKLVCALNELNIPAKLISFPDRNLLTGKVIDSYLTKKVELSDQAVHLLFSANRWELEPEIKRLINDGVTLVVDRYSYSGVAYSAAKQVMDFKWCKNPDAGLPKPDLVLFLSLSIEEISRRKGFGADRYEHSEFQEQVAKQFTLLKDNSWKEIDANTSKEELHLKIMDIVKSDLDAIKEKKLGVLW